MQLPQAHAKVDTNGRDLSPWMGSPPKICASTRWRRSQPKAFLPQKEEEEALQRENPTRSSQLTPMLGHSEDLKQPLSRLVRGPSATVCQLPSFSDDIRCMPLQNGMPQSGLHYFSVDGNVMGANMELKPSHTCITGP